MAHEACGDIVDEGSPLKAGGDTAYVVKDSDDGDLGNVPLSKDSFVHIALRGSFAVIQVLRLQLSIWISDETAVVFRLAL